MSMTPRQQDQAWIEADRAENLRLASMGPRKRQVEHFERMCWLMKELRADGRVFGVQHVTPAGFWINGAGR